MRTKTLTHDQKMYRLGYRYRLTPTNLEFAPLYAKTLAEIGKVFRDWHEYDFSVKEIDPLDIMEVK